VGDCVKGLTEVQTDDIRSSSLAHSYKTNRLVRQESPLVKPCWLSWITSLSSMCL